MIKKQILDIKEWSPMQAVIAFSASATVLPFVKTFWGVDLDNPILHLHGGSTSGKSTVLKLNAGLGSNPAKKKAFWLTHESSLVALIKRIGNNMGYPVSIDELSSAKRKEYDEFVYSLGNGEEKDRVKAGGVGLQESASFSTVIMSSGEVSLLRKCSSNEGIRARYKGCKQELCRFMSNILMADMVANNLDSAECVLFLPDGGITIRVGVKCDVKSGNYADEEAIKTKIGVFRPFTWQMLCDIKKEHNPVKICFGHIGEYLHFMLCKLGWTDEDLAKNTITSEVLDAYHIQEPVSIHDSIMMYMGIDRFCNDGKEL